MKVKKSITDAIQEEPERFMKYFNVNKIKSAKNPQLEFLTQFRNKFGDKGGLFLWNYLYENYDLINKFWKIDKLQESVKEKGNLDREVVVDFFNKYKESLKKKQIITEEKVRKNIVKSYVREKKKIKQYNKSDIHRYNNLQNRFILSKKDQPLYVVAEEFNRYFKTKLTKVAIRDKRLRLLGKKK